MYYWYIVEGKNGIYYCIIGIFNVYRYNDYVVVLLVFIEIEVDFFMFI